MTEEQEDLLIDREDYLANGVHIGTRSQHKDMDPYIFHVKKNQLAVLDVEQSDKQIREIAKEIARYNLEEVLVIGRKPESHKPLKMFSKSTGTDVIMGRFMPGTLTNPENDDFTEPEMVIVTDPEEDQQAVKEAAQSNIPVVAIADSENSLENIDHVIAANNKAESSIGTVYYLLAQQIHEEKGIDFSYELEDFKTETEQEEDEEE